MASSGVKEYEYSSGSLFESIGYSVGVKRNERTRPFRFDSKDNWGIEFPSISEDSTNYGLKKLSKQIPVLQIIHR